MVLSFHSAAFGIDLATCISRCDEKLNESVRGNPREDVRASLEMRWGNCKQKCEESTVSTKPTDVVSLKKELDSCRAQLQIVQEKEPSIYSKLFREVKKIDSYEIAPVKTKKEATTPK